MTVSTGMILKYIKANYSIEGVKDISEDIIFDVIKTVSEEEELIINRHFGRA